MIRGVVFIGTEPEGAVLRLQRGGLQACLCFDASAVASISQDWGLTAGNVLVLGQQQHASGLLSWKDVSNKPQQPDMSPSSDRIMQAVVQHNRRCILAAAAATAASSTPGEQPQAVACPDGAAAGTATTAEPTQPANTAPAAPTSAASSQPAPPVLVVGYVMKSSREEQLAASGLLHLLPAGGLCFMPFDVTRLSEDQGHIDLLLHKGSDELVTGPNGSVAWSQRLLDLQAWLAGQPQICVVDPFPNTARVLDRLVLHELLDQLQHLQLPGGVVARPPRNCQVDEFAAPGLPSLLESKGIAAPFIVKPVVACGVQHSHSMALVLHSDALQQLQDQLPLPAVVQEFVNHGGLQYKVYVLGDKVMVTPRASIPDVFISPDLSTQQQLLLFDSLASLPTQLPAHMAQLSAAAGQGTGVVQQQKQQQQQQQQQPDPQALEAMAAFLRSKLGLTLFGFDVVIASHSLGDAAAPAHFQAVQSAQQELVVIDINYFPNYRGGSNTPSMFRDALRQCWKQHRAA